MKEVVEKGWNTRKERKMKREEVLAQANAMCRRIAAERSTSAACAVPTLSAVNAKVGISLKF